MKNLIYLFIILISFNRCNTPSSSKEKTIPVSAYEDDYVTAAKRINDIYHGSTKFQRHFTNSGVLDSLLLTVDVHYSDSTCDYLGEAIARNIAFEFVNNINFHDQMSINGVIVKLNAPNSSRTINLEKEKLEDWSSQLFIAENFISKLALKEDYSELLSTNLKTSNFKFEMDNIFQVKKNEFGEFNYVIRFGLIKYHSTSLDKRISNIWFLAEHNQGHYLIEIALGIEDEIYKIHGASVVNLIEVKNKTKSNTS